MQTTGPSSITRMGSLIDRIEQSLKTAEAQSVLPPGASDLVRTVLAASFASKDGDSIVMQNVQATQPKIAKTWHQMESRRIKQWRSRVKKRAESQAEAMKDNNHTAESSL
jgi:hypothetical protein